MKTIHLVIPLFVGVILATSGCGSATTYQDEPGNEVTVSENADPQIGWVIVVDYDRNSGTPTIAKRCDGTTLLYVSNGYREGGISVIQNSPECAR